MNVDSIDDCGGVVTTNNSAATNIAGESDITVAPSIQSIQKKPFALKTNRPDGTLLAIHHTANDGDHKQRIPFSVVHFNPFNDIIMTIDGRGNAFVFDLLAIVHWRLANAMPSGAVVDFVPKQRTMIAYGTTNGTVSLMDLDSATVITQQPMLDGHIRHLHFMTPDLLLCATRTACRLCRCDGPTIEPKQMLFKTNTAGLTIKLIRYLVDATTLKGRIIVLFSDDSLRVWCLCDNDTDPVGSGAWQCVTHVRLIEQRDLRLQQNSARAITNAYRVSGAVTDQSRNAQFMEKLTTDYTKPLVGLAEFVGDNTLMLGMSDGYLMLVNVVDWTVEAVYSLPGIAFSGLRGFGGFGGNCDRQLNHANVIPIVLNKERLGFFEISHDNGQCRALGLMQRRDTVTAGQRSHNGKLLGVVANKGKTYIHDFTAILMGFKNRSNNIDCSMRERDVEMINKELRAVLSPKRLHAMLETYGEYPVKYRCIIWKRILLLPDNTKAFTVLLKKGAHPAVMGIDDQFPLADATKRRSLKKILSCLAHWSQILGQCISVTDSSVTTNFLPTFALPFVQTFGDDSIGCFETIATILLNQCQLWFEFWPLRPTNYLGFVENILGHFEPALLRHFTHHSITSATFAWQLLRSLFTSVLADFQWMRLLDHIISNPPHFLPFAVVAYNIVQKRVLLRLTTQQDIERFFAEENAIDMKPFIAKIYHLVNNCPRRLHPQRFMHPFKSLQIGQYQKLVGYPQKIVAVRNAQMDDLRAENQLLNHKLHELEVMERSLIERLTSDWRQDEHERRLKMVEELYAEAMMREEQRVAYQRKQLILYQRQLSDRETEVLEAVQLGRQRKFVQQREDELRAFLVELQRRKIRDENELILAEDNLRNQEMTLMVNRNATKTVDGTLAGKYSKPLCNLHAQQQKLMDDIRMAKSRTVNRPPSKAQ